MKLREFLDNLNKLAKERPETLDFDIVSSKDDEGNGFDLVYYEPTVGTYNSKDKDFQEELKPNAVCIN
jgi:hypothetical protein